MRDTKEVGLCLRATDVGESDKLCNIYIIGKGKLAVKFKSVKKSKGKLSSSAAPLALGEYLLMERNGYYTCIGCDIVSTFMPIWSDIDKYYCAMSALELLDRFSNDNQVVDDLAMIVIDYITTLSRENYCIVDYMQFLHRYYVVAGYGIDISGYCSKCGETLGTTYYNLRTCMFNCSDCKGDIEISPAAVSLLIALTNGDVVSDGLGDREVIEATSLIIRLISQVAESKLVATNECLMFISEGL